MLVGTKKVFINIFFIIYCFDRHHQTCSHRQGVSSGAKCYTKVPRLSRSNIFL